MTEIDKKGKLLPKPPTDIVPYDPRARKELIVRGLTALADVQDAGFYFFRGEEFRLRGEYREAILNYEKAIELNPDNGEYYYYLAFAQEDLDLYEETIESFKHAIELNPDNANYHYSLALAQEDLDLHKEAIESFETFLRLENHELQDAQQYIAYAKERIEQLREVPQKTTETIGKKILVVDDDVDWRMMLKDVLTLPGYSVSTAKDGRDALNKLQESNTPFDLIITGIATPGMNGDKMVSIIRKQGIDTPILVISGGCYERGCELVIEDLVSSCLAKPVNSNELLNEVNQLLSASE